MGEGLPCAAVLWLLNAVVVLPLGGEGFAGACHLALRGSVGFATARTLFFVLLAVLYGPSWSSWQSQPAKGSIDHPG